MLFILALLMAMPLVTNGLGYNPLGVFFRGALTTVFNIVEPLMGLFRWFYLGQASKNESLYLAKVGH